LDFENYSEKFIGTVTRETSSWPHAR